ncbi:CocE/NonD family hydrolase C-terminal non-catalytic domain-containing protein [Sphingobium sp. H39-3-25]|uniref:CocE/NonD family hydrolase n=1 Tax=Sphingobium arseniciresistens TaxID=3030834 RepID=UPI0023B9D2A2|nr:CocE/NonD family hydrolase C-terminal non-catalytic domain-containing protein [Sphingobium arseniciresistens]
MRCFSVKLLMLFIAGIILADVGAGCARAGTPYPGGQWEPGPEKYGVALIEHLKLTMDDGVILDATAAYPADPATGKRVPGRFPVVIEDTPYTFESIPPNAAGGPVNSYYTHYGYISVRVYSRGTGESGGRHDYWSPREARDGAQMVRWAASKLDGSDGRVALVGCSFPGGHALGDAAMVGKNSPLKAVVAACIALDNVDRNDMLVSGVPTQDISFMYYGPALWMGGNPETIRQYRAFAEEMMRGGAVAYDGAYWKQRLPMSLARNIVDNGVPVLLWTGWKDPVGIGAIRTYAAFQNSVAGRPLYAAMTPKQKVSPRYQIIVGNNSHGEALDNGIMLQWLETWVKGVDTGLQETDKPMHLFEVGSNRWVNAARVPMVDRYTAFNLGGDGSLAPVSPSQPASRDLAWGDPGATGTKLEFVTAPFAEKALLSGAAALSIDSETSNRNLELIAALFDVAPDGTSKRITQGVMIGSLRRLDAAKSWRDENGLPIWPWQTLDKDQFLKPGRVYTLDIYLEPRQWAILSGHRLKLQLTTAADPSACPGPEKASPGNDPCYLTDIQKGTIPGGKYRIHFGPKSASRLMLPLAQPGPGDGPNCKVTPTSDKACLPHDWRN